VRIPSLFYGKAGKAMGRVRKYARALVASGDYSAFDPGPMLDTREVPGLILVEDEWEPVPGENFHLHSLAEELIHAVPSDRAPVRDELNKWLLASLDDESRFVCTLSGLAHAGLLGRKGDAQKYLAAAIRHYPAIDADRDRFMTPSYPQGILHTWRTLFVALEHLGLPSVERLEKPGRDPQALLEELDRRRARA
jgi:hypothetical protein